ncbi:transposase [Parasutterella excrementihominis]|uniref:IS1634 family transposase n=3 Tax=Parasutterella excrementihominis TaxID=487175 RepID=UPI003A8E5474
MGRPRVYDTPHFCLHTYVRKGHTYVEAYRNEWDPEKKRSRIAQRKYVGALDTETGRVRLGKKYLSENPQYEGKILYYEDKQLVERTPEELQEELSKRVPSPLNDIVSYGASAACWLVAQQSGMLEDLKETFGAEVGSDLLRLAIYQYLDGGSMDCFEQWASQHWLPKARTFSGQRISEMLSEITHQDITSYLKLRNQRCVEHFNSVKTQAEKLKKTGPRFRYLALDSTALSTYSVTISNAAYGYAKQNPELRQVNFTLGVDYLNGDVCYAYESEGSITDKSVYPHLMMDLHHNGYNLQDTVIVTDRGYQSIYNIQRLLDIEINYVCGVPLTEESVKQLFEKYKSSLSNPAFLNGRLKVAARTTEELWAKATDFGPLRLSTSLHLYKYLELAAQQAISLHQRAEEVLEKKNGGEKVHPADWSRVRNYIVENSQNVWVKNIKGLEEFLTRAGCFAIRTNCIEDPFECLAVYKQRQIVETAFRQMKVLNGNNRLRCTERTYVGKLLLFVIAQSLRMKMLYTVKENEQKLDLELPGDSLDKAMAMLKGIMAVRPPSKSVWAGRPISKKARDILELLGINNKFPRNLKD